MSVESPVMSIAESVALTAVDDSPLPAAFTPLIRIEYEVPFTEVDEDDEIAVITSGEEVPPEARDFHVAPLSVEYSKVVNEDPLEAPAVNATESCASEGVLPIGIS